MATNLMEHDQERRRLLVTASSVIAATGTMISIWPFISSMRPSARAYAEAANVQVDVSKQEAGSQLTVIWRKLPIWILRRTDEMLINLENEKLLKQLRDPNSEVKNQQPDYVVNNTRSVKPEILVVTAVCTHLGCAPVYHPETGVTEFSDQWWGGYYCPCHGSLFDLAGRVYKNVPAPTNLMVPHYHYLSANVIEIGVDQNE